MYINRDISAVKKEALEKLAFFGSASVSGSPSYTQPGMTVGQFMYNMNNPAVANNMSGNTRRTIQDSIVNSGLDVNAPASSLIRSGIKAGLGALAGNFISNALGFGPFARGVLTATGAHYGYSR